MATQPQQTYRHHGPSRAYSQVCALVRRLRARCNFMLQHGKRKGRVCGLQGQLHIRLYSMATVHVWLCPRHVRAIEKRYGQKLKLEVIDK